MASSASTFQNSAWQALLGGTLAQQLGDVSEPKERISTGCPPLDRALTEGALTEGASTEVLAAGGITRGSLLEFVNGADSSAATLLALLAAQEAGRAGGAIVLVDRAQTFYPPAAAAWGIAMDRVIVIHPANEKDELWGLDQALRCTHVAVVVGWPQKIDSITFRRFQLAVERSGCLGVMVRPPSALREPSWADFRISVEPLIQVDQRSTHDSHSDGFSTLGFSTLGFSTLGFSTLAAAVKDFEVPGKRSAKNHQASGG